MHRRAFLFVLCLLPVALWAVWWFAFHGQPLSVIFRPPPEEIPYPAALDELAEVDVYERRLQSVLEQLSERYGVEILLDSIALQDEKITGQEPVTGQLAGVPLRTILDLLVQQADERLIIGVRQGRVYVSTESAWYKAEANYQARLYLLTPLLAVAGGISEQEVASLVSCVGPPAAWNGGGLGVVRPLPGALLVGQTPEVHRQIDWLLKQLAAIHESRREPASLDLSDPHPEASAAVARALDSAVELDFQGVRLDKALKWVQKQHDIPVWLDAKALAEKGVRPSSRLTRRQPHLPLRLALKFSLQDLGLTYSVRGGALIVTAADHRQEESVCLHYPGVGITGGLADLTDSDETLAARSRSIEQSLADITYSVGRRPLWDFFLAPRLISQGGGFFVVSDTWTTQQEIAHFLGLVRLALQPHWGAPTVSPEVALVDSCAKVEEVLRREISPSFRNADLKDVVSDLERRCQVPVRLTPPNEWPLSPFPQVLQAVQPSSPPESLTINYTADRVPLAVALREMLRPVKMDFYVHHETIWLAPAAGDGGSWFAETRLYRVRKSPVGDRQEYGMRDVLRMAGAVLEPKNWQSTTRVLQGQDRVFVTQPRAVHERFAALLQGLEQLRAVPSQTEPMLIGDPHATPQDEIRLYPLAALRRAQTQRPARRPAVESEKPGSAWYKAWQAAAHFDVLAEGESRREDRRFQPTASGEEELRKKLALARALPGWEAEGSRNRLAALWSRADGTVDGPVLGELVSALVQPKTWKPSVRRSSSTEAGEQTRRDSGVLASLPDVLIVRQTAEVHAEIRRFLDFLAAPTEAPPNPELNDQIQSLFDRTRQLDQDEEETP